MEAAIAGIRRDLPPRFYQELPELEGAGIPRVLAIAWAYVAHTDSTVRFMVRVCQQYWGCTKSDAPGEAWVIASASYIRDR